MPNFKIDENLHEDAAVFLRQHGHDAMTVYEQGLRGASDRDIASVCKMESRTLIALDLDFADLRTYPPNHYSGLLVLRLVDQSRPAILGVLKRILPILETETLVGRLWIVDEKQIRIRGEKTEKIEADFTTAGNRTL
jgi:predicted nuclease of predicted toxin-antitoxin system